MAKALQGFDIDGGDRYSFRPIMKRRWPNHDGMPNPVLKAFASLESVGPVREAETDLLGFALVPAKRPVRARHAKDEMHDQLMARDAYVYWLDQPERLRQRVVGWLIKDNHDDQRVGTVPAYVTATKTGTTFHTHYGYTVAGVAYGTGPGPDQKQSLTTMEQHLRSRVEWFDMDAEWVHPD